MPSLISELILGVIYLVASIFGIYFLIKSKTKIYSLVLSIASFLFVVVGIVFLFSVPFFPILYWFLRQFSNITLIIINFLIGLIALYAHYTSEN